jgi:predicted acylesterase/phospholipase RssA
MNIALAFSGGGYRAAAFDLGVISYLANIRIEGGVLLEHVTILSTVSGGTITGSKYALGIKQGKGVNEIYDSLYSFMSEVDLVSLALDRLTSNKGWDDNRTKSLINAIADVYDAYLFKNEKFGLLLSDDPSIHLKHISFNATEFANALQFRFQCSEQILSPQENEPERAIIGNYFFRIPSEIAQHIRMADILAASSCFPGGFEPINFPNDFILPPHSEIQELKKKSQYPVGLMDGGIVDNQGIGPILLAEARIKRNQANVSGIMRADNAIDLIIVSDVASPYMEDYKASQQKTAGLWRKFSLQWIFLINSVFLLSSGYFIYHTIQRNQVTWLIASVVVFTLSVLLFVSARFIKSLPKKAHVPTAFLKPMGKLLRLRLGVYETMLINRLDSMLKMTNDVFLKHIRRLNYQAIFTDSAWENRRIMNAIYELQEGETRVNRKVENGTLAPELLPNSKLKIVATKACNMGTTLWFTKEELQITEENPYNLLDCVIACGQFTICWNLLEYIGKIKKNSTNATEEVKKIIDCENQLLQDWEQFKVNPFWRLKPKNK